uniref:Post-SET domain-containing protein n=1 Tax=Romanomermis culicivorax TaxID=13658 RepID=A0A915K572_ROMCU
FFIRAAKNLETSELIYDEEPCHLPVVSRKYVDEHFLRDPNLMKCFYEYCYQCGPDLICIWETDPKKWKPINHSCDPNAWLEGLALVARRTIKKGEEITIDYATYAYLEDKDAEEKNQFECHCGTKECRNIIRPNVEYKMVEIVDKYKGHFTTYLEALIEKNARKMTNGCSSF